MCRWGWSYFKAEGLGTAVEPCPSMLRDDEAFLWHTLLECAPELYHDTTCRDQKSCRHEFQIIFITLKFSNSGSS